MNRLRGMSARIDRLLFLHADKIMWFCFAGGLVAVAYLLA